MLDFSILFAAGLLSTLLILVLKPLLVRYALARPNARSSHKVPTPQGGGIAVVSAALLIALGTFVLFGLPSGPFQDFLIVAVASIILAVVGAIDDIRPLPAVLRLVLQMIAVAAVVLVSRAHVFPELVPFGVEAIILILAGTWFVNLVNFMDGLDWITVAEMVPVTAAIATLGPMAGLSIPMVFVAIALCGALIGFAPFNKPVARLFLGDVGSLSIGLLVGWLLLQLAGTGALAAAILLPLYYLMDATITLFRRLARGEKVWEAHRSHFYQKATDNGFSALAVSTHVFGLNIALAGLAAVTIFWSSLLVQIACLAIGVALVAWLLNRFAHPRPEISR
ncbi:MraY family glycosyltransferase [Microvirga puerhi]|uniref:Glycosyltransferase family 4 protein n=1 Tax=Microvirga puerhi TaxID=2876078 RepID=A0ABS7VNM7_9HYPH|nr:glycosyltransferase family 4 protein [Microvirga puerhi]MBZ6077136.1 glycosyltransferase family 4 protein [Microvirga puerhi]